MSDTDDDTTVYRVVINHEEQYSIWPDWKDLPLGWTAVGPTGSKDVCLEYIKDTWTDMRPLSLRQSMDGRNDKS
ncbi:MAG: MbtH family NRPS accessory protein [Acidobacteriota bacterium]|nr:MbtH family NRPS accessory protein [Acidobacteriota bacterium]